MVRIIGKQDRDEFELDPLEAHRRGRKLDKMLKRPSSARPGTVIRAPHRHLNELDDRRALEAAARLNRPG
jgi:hypothetical protein